MSIIRNLSEKDIPLVAALYQKLNQNSDPGYAKPSFHAVCEAFEEIFLRNPWRVKNLCSLVCEDSDGAIRGFIGVSPRKMTLKGRPILAAVSAHLMIEQGRQSGLAGVRLLQQFLSGPQQLSIADLATETGRKVWDGIGARTSYIHSLQWVKTLRPSARALSLAAGKFHLSPRLSSIACPLTRLSDAMLARLSPHRFRFVPPDLVAKNLDDETLLSCISQFSSFYSMAPEYDEITLPWLIRRAEIVKRAGELRKIALHDNSGRIVGWYLFYLKPGGSSEVLQLCARKGSAGAVLDHLFHHAWSNGAELVVGRLDPHLLPDLSARECYLKGGPPWVLIHARDPEILQAIDRGDVFLSKLEGEWCAGYRV